MGTHDMTQGTPDAVAKPRTILATLHGQLQASLSAGALREQDIARLQGEIDAQAAELARAKQDLDFARKENTYLLEARNTLFTHLEITRKEIARLQSCIRELEGMQGSNGK